MPEKFLAFFVEVSAGGAFFVGFGLGARNQGQGFRPEALLPHLELGDFQLDKARDPFSQARDSVGFCEEIVWYFKGH
jgi:hypothetical protein